MTTDSEGSRMSEANPKPTQDPPRPAGASIESLREDLRQMFAAAMHHGACWEIGWTAEAAEPRLRAVLTELESLRAERDALLKGEHLLFSQRHLPVVIAERDALRAELETERLRLAACGAAALGNTEKALAKRITPGNPYYSATYSDVCRAVDREMALRAELAAERAKREEAERDCGDLRAILKDEQGTVMHLRNLLEDREAERDEARTRADAAEARCEALAARVAAMTTRANCVFRWLNKNQPDVYDRGLYAALGHTHQSFQTMASNEAAADLSARDARIRREALEAAAARVADRAWLIELPDSEAGYAVHFDLLNKVILSPAPDAAQPNNQQEQP